MKDKMKSIKHSLGFVIIIVCTITLYPIFYDKFEERLVIIRQLINLLIFITLLNYTNRSIKKYSFGIYKFYKLLGVKEIENVINYIKNSAFVYFLCFALFFATAYAGNIISALLCTAQFVLYCIGFILISYVLMHKLKCRTVLNWLFAFLCIGYTICFFYRLSKLIISNMTVREFLIFLNNSVLMKIHRMIFFEFNLYCVIAVVILLVFVVRKIILLEDVSVIDESSKRRNCSGDTRFHKFFGINRCGLLRNIKIAFRNKENLFSYFLLFVVYALCCWLFGYVSQLLFVASLFCVVLVNMGLEGIYLNDVGTFQLYKVCGEGFDGFLRNKIKISVLINFIFLGVYTIKCMQHSFAKEWIVLLLFQLMNIVYWNMYYSYLYSGLSLTRTMFCEMNIMIALVIGLIPVVNLVFVIMYYMKGKRRWICYVNNE